MTRSPDDDALSWAGDADPTLVHGGEVADDSSGDDDEAARAPGTGSLALVGVGILAGIYLLYTIGWFIGVSRLGNPLADPLARTLFSFGSWISVAAPLLWFTLTYWLTGDRPRSRFVWLILGAVLLAPLPFGVGAGLLS
jgi:hypothetical protein